MYRQTEHNRLMGAIRALKIKHGYTEDSDTDDGEDSFDTDDNSFEEDDKQ